MEKKVQRNFLWIALLVLDTCPPQPSHSLSDG